ncbi:MAG: conserved hypothetical protein [Methanobrevibacter sp. CfCl-M3]
MFDDTIKKIGKYDGESPTAELIPVIIGIILIFSMGLNLLIADEIYPHSTKVISGSGNIYVGDTYTYNVDLRSEFFNPFADKNVVNKNLMIKVYDSNNLVTNYNITTDTSGKADLKLNGLPVGTYKIESIFNGDEKYLNSSKNDILEVKKVPTTLSSSSSATSYFNENYTYKLSLKGNGNKLTNKSISVSIYDNQSKVVKTDILTTDNNGEATLNLNLPLNSYVINSSYIGDEKYENSLLSNNLNIVEKPKPVDNSSKTNSSSSSSNSGSGSSNQGSSTLYYASVNSDVFHIAGCYHIKQIKESNLIVFKNRSEAIDSGRRPCKDCNP